MSGCASNNVVTEVVNLPPVARELMRAPGVPKCSLPARESYEVAEVIAYAKCYQAAYQALAYRLRGLQKAVAVREAAAAKAAKAAEL